MNLIKAAVFSAALKVLQSGFYADYLSQWHSLPFGAVRFTFTHTRLDRHLLGIDGKHARRVDKHDVVRFFYRADKHYATARILAEV